MYISDVLNDTSLVVAVLGFLSAANEPPGQIKKVENQSKDHRCEGPIFNANVFSFFLRNSGPPVKSRDQNEIISEG